MVSNAISGIRPGATSADVVRHFPAAQEFGFAAGEEAFGQLYLAGSRRFTGVAQPAPGEDG